MHKNIVLFIMDYYRILFIYIIGKDIAIKYLIYLLYLLYLKITHALNIIFAYCLFRSDSKIQ